MMQRGQPLLYLLAAAAWLPSAVGQAGATVAVVPQVGATPCFTRNSECLATYAGASGRSDVVHCAAFRVYDMCFRNNINSCKVDAGQSSSSSGTSSTYTAEAEQFHKEYERIIKLLPYSCQVSLTPMDSSGSNSASSEIVLPTSVSSYASMPASMRTRPVGTSSLFMTWWQWAALALCGCCFCSGGILMAAFGKRRNKNQGNRGSYDDYEDEEEEWGEPVAHQGYPLMSPAAGSFVQQPTYQYMAPAVTSYAGGYNAAGSYAQPYSYAAAMPIQFNQGGRRMY